MKNLKYIWLRLLGYKPYVIELIDREEWIYNIQYLSKNGDRWVYDWFTPSSLGGSLFTESFRGRVIFTERVNEFYKIEDLRLALVPESILKNLPWYSPPISNVPHVTENITSRFESTLDNPGI